MLKTLIFITLVLLLASNTKKLTVSCISQCKTLTNCTAVCYVYDFGTTSTQVCMNSTNSGTTAITSCPSGLPYTYDVSSCQNPNASASCANSSSCCIRITMDNQCITGLSSSITCPTGSSFEIISSNCSSTPSCSSGQCLKTSYNISSFVSSSETCLNSTYASILNYYIYEKFTYQACSTSSCSSGCCFTGVFEGKNCNSNTSLASWGIFDKEFCSKALFQKILNYCVWMLAIIGLIFIE